jgi:hypothetical protein
VSLRTRLVRGSASSRRQPRRLVRQVPFRSDGRLRLRKQCPGFAAVGRASLMPDDQRVYCVWPALASVGSGPQTKVKGNGSLVLDPEQKCCVDRLNPRHIRIFMIGSAPQR